MKVLIFVDPFYKMLVFDVGESYYSLDSFGIIKHNIKERSYFKARTKVLDESI